MGADGGYGFYKCKDRSRINETRIHLEKFDFLYCREYRGEHHVDYIKLLDNMKNKGYDLFGTTGDFQPNLNIGSLQEFLNELKELTIELGEEMTFQDLSDFLFILQDKQNYTYYYKYRLIADKMTCLDFCLDRLQNKNEKIINYVNLIEELVDLDSYTYVETWT